MGRFLALVSLALLLVLPAHAASRNAPSDFEKQVDGLRGHWFSDSGPANVRVVLYVSNVVQVSGNGAKLAAYWGLAPGPWRDAQAVAKDAAGRLTLELLTWGKATVTLEPESADALTGKIALADGKTFPVRLMRSSQARIHEWLASNPLPGARATKDSVIELAYVSAADCPYCRGWEIEYLEGGAPKASLGWSGVGLTTVKIATFKASVRSDGFPSHLREPIAQLLKERGWTYFTGTPQYILLVNGKVRAYAFGTTNFASLIHPALQAALAEKQGTRP